MTQRRPRRQSWRWYPWQWRLCRPCRPCRPCRLCWPASHPLTQHLRSPRPLGMRRGQTRTQAQGGSMAEAMKVTDGLGAPPAPVPLCLCAPADGLHFTWLFSQYISSNDAARLVVRSTLCLRKQSCGSCGALTHLAAAALQQLTGLRLPQHLYHHVQGQRAASRQGQAAPRRARPRRRRWFGVRPRSSQRPCRTQPASARG